MRSAIVCLAIPFAALAQPAPATNAPREFPVDATSPTRAELQSFLSGKVLRGKPSIGDAWRIQYNENGYAFLNAGTFADSGKWKVDDGKLCSEWQKANSGCGEVRIKANVLYLKRGNGEVVALTVE